MFHSIQSPSKIEALVKTLEKEREYYKDECETLQGMLRKRLMETGSPSSKRKGRSKGKVHIYFIVLVRSVLLLDIYMQLRLLLHFWSVKPKLDLLHFRSIEIMSHWAENKCTQLLQSKGSMCEQVTTCLSKRPICSAGFNFCLSQDKFLFKYSFWSDILYIWNGNNLLTNNTLTRITQDVLVRCSVIVSDHNANLARHF